MIVKLVQRVEACAYCPNFRRKPMPDFIEHENFMCLSSGKKLGDSRSRLSQVNIRTKVSTLCPDADEEVNQISRSREK